MEVVSVIEHVAGKVETLCAHGTPRSPARPRCSRKDETAEARSRRRAASIASRSPRRVLLSPTPAFRGTSLRVLAQHHPLSPLHASSSALLLPYHPYHPQRTMCTLAARTATCTSTGSTSPRDPTARYGCRLLLFTSPPSLLPLLLPPLSLSPSLPLSPALTLPRRVFSLLPLPFSLSPLLPLSPLLLRSPFPQPSYEGFLEIRKPLGHRRPVDQVQVFPEISRVVALCDGNVTVHNMQNLEQVWLPRSPRVSMQATDVLAVFLSSFLAHFPHCSCRPSTAPRGRRCFAATRRARCTGCALR